MKKITLDDIRNALSQLDKLPIKRTNFTWGWIETNDLGSPINIGLNKKARDALRSLEVMEAKYVGDGEIKTIYGLKILCTELEDLE